VNSVVPALFTIAKTLVDAVSGPQTVSRELGEVVPMPTLPVLVILIHSFAVALEAE